MRYDSVGFNIELRGYELSNFYGLEVRKRMLRVRAILP